MKSRLFMSMVAIALAAALIAGGTMAWFTAKVDAPQNEFTAGTVMIEAGQEVVFGEHPMDNVNPGDCFVKCVQVYNTGTKDIELRLDGMEFGVDINWGWIYDNWEALCFSDWDGGYSAFKDAVQSAAVTNPAHAAGDANGPFDDDDRLINPLMAAPCPGSGWIMKYVDGSMVFYYPGGLKPGEVAELCVALVFDGPWMGNLWQGATFTMGGGKFQAVQASNNAPQAVWGQGTWDNYQEVATAGDAAAQLEEGVDETYAGYFYDSGSFLFDDCCLATARVTTQEELNAALANPEIERIKLYGTFDGFFVERSDIVIQGGTIHPQSLGGEMAGIYLRNAVDGVLIEGVTVVGDSGVTDRGMLATDGTKAFTVRNSTFTDLTTGIYANSDMFGGRELTATGNTFTGCVAGIGGTENTLLHAIASNTFDTCTEGIGLGGGVSSSIVSDADLISYLLANNTFTTCTNDVADYR